MNVQERVPLAPFTAFGVGGVARFFIEARSREEVREALAFAHAHALPLLVLGGGSNIVVSDDGFDGLVLAPRVSGITTEARDDRIWATVGAGVVWDEFVVYTIEQELKGLNVSPAGRGRAAGPAPRSLG